MRLLSESELLLAWEQGLPQTPTQRALTLLTAACPDTPPDTLAQLNIGQRDSRLLTLRGWTFGPQLVSLATCPGCGERLELSFEVADIRTSLLSQNDDGEKGETLSLAADGYEVCFRSPNSLDLLNVSYSQDLTTTRRALLQRCLLAAERDGKEIACDQLPTDVIDAVVERMERADPTADIQLDLFCPLCSHRWQEVLDIVSFFWSEIDAWAQRTLREVHALASVYGWLEGDILAMSPWRRQAYLELINPG